MAEVKEVVGFTNSIEIRASTCLGNEMVYFCCPP